MYGSKNVFQLCLNTGCVLSEAKSKVSKVKHFSSTATLAPFLTRVIRYTNNDTIIRLEAFDMHSLSGEPEEVDCKHGPT